MLQQLDRFKYQISLAFFFSWLLFFDSNSVVYMYKQYRQLKDLQAQETFLKGEIAEMREQKDALFSSDERLEKFAREAYFFKRPEEDIYIVE